MEKRDKNALTEAEFLAQYKTKTYPRPSLTADIVLFGDNRTHLLLIQRGGHPYLGDLAFPGGFAEPGETIETTAQREMEEETGLSGIPMKLAGIFSRPGRDPRGWTVSAAFYADVKTEDCKAVAGDDAASAEWYALKEDGNIVTLTGQNETVSFQYETDKEATRVCFLTETILAFDHAEILVKALMTEIKE